MKTLRRYKNLAQALLSQKHRLLLKFQRANLIETSSTSSDSDDNKFDELKLMESKNPMVRLVQYGNIKKMMKGFQNAQLTDLERNMMRGLYIRSLKDFNESVRKSSKQSLYERLKG